MMKNNVNKKGSNFKKLIPAAGMLAVSAMMLATSTYAWFSMSTKVSATNIEMKATASKNLLITKTGANADDYAASVDMAISQTSLVPVSTIGGDTVTPAFLSKSVQASDNSEPFILVKLSCALALAVPVHSINTQQNNSLKMVFIFFLH